MGPLCYRRLIINLGITTENYKWQGWSDQEINAKFEEMEFKKKKRKLKFEDIVKYEEKNEEPETLRAITNFENPDEILRVNSYGRAPKTRPLSKHEKYPLG